MRFKSGIHNTNTFTKFTASLASLGQVAWVRLNNSEVRFTIIPEQGTQVWAVLSIDSIFENYTIQSAAINNTINLEVPLGPLLRALRSAAQAVSASIRLTKKDNIPLLTLTLITSSLPNSNSYNAPRDANFDAENEFDAGESDLDALLAASNGAKDSGFAPLRERETIITHDVPVRVLTADKVEGLHEPRCREPDVHIVLPPLIQLKAVSDRFSRLAGATAAGLAGGGSASSSTSKSPKLEMWANMHGCLRLGLSNDAMNISSVWTGLANPELDPTQVEGGEDGIRMHPSTKMRELGGPSGDGDEGWAKVRIDSKDWSRVLSVGRLEGRVIACFCNDHALILYVYLSNDDDGEEESVLTYYISSYSR